MRTLSLFLTLFCLAFFNVAGSQAERKTNKKMHTNRLAKEKSPYLLQHKHNPVDWYPWSEEAFAKAEKENKLIFLSIGYSTCYWCHVMEKDSFELDDVAEILNKHYVAIKVDREERPDVDQIYMDAIITISGRGGWPMSVFLKPDRTPFFGGTFFWRDQFKQILTQVADTWKDNPDKVNQSAKSLFSALENRKIVAGDGDVDEEVFQQVFGQLKSSFDSQYGGFGRAPKFPHSENVAILLRIHRRSGNKEALRMAEETLQKIAYGGIYDHLGGGFARYSTDEKWLVPHFEKMLYDNGLLTAVYLDAARATGNTLYSDIAADTLNYVLREMTSNEGGFYSAQDAGEVNKEGEFYVWKEEELKDILEEKEFKEIKSLYGVSKEGNFEHNNNVLHIVHPNKWSDKSKPLVKSAQKKLFEYRDQKREHPHKDDKILTSWNGLMITAMAKGYQVLGDKRYLEAAQKAAAFIKKELFTGERLLRRYRDGEAGFAAYVDDYAFLIQGLLDLYESDFDQQWLEFAKELQSIQDKLLWDNKEDGYFFAEAESKDLILRKKDYNDGALPSGNSISALNLLRLHDLYFERDYLEKAKDIFAAMSGGLERYPSGFGAALVALDYFFDSSKEIVAVGPHDSKESQELKDYLHKNFNPSRVIAFGQGVSLEDSKAPTVFRGKQVINKKTTFYVCENHTCKAPTTDVAKAKQQIEEFKKLAIN